MARRRSPGACKAQGCGTITTDTYCEGHRPKGRASRSPSTQAQDAEYRRNRRALLAGDPPCFWCGRPATTADHLLPVARGGGNELSNLVPACTTCNCSRQANPDWTGPRS